jgi:hypothetical protein
MCDEDVEITIGDLVRLEDDEDFMIGIGIVIDVASDNHSFLDEFFGPIDFDLEDEDENNKLFLHRPVFLVLWAGDKNYFNDDGNAARPLWFFANELKLVNKASKD